MDSDKERGALLSIHRLQIEWRESTIEAKPRQALRPGEGFRWQRKGVTFQCRMLIRILRRAERRTYFSVGVFSVWCVEILAALAGARG